MAEMEKMTIDSMPASAEGRAGAKSAPDKIFVGKRGKLLNLLTIWVGLIVLFCVFSYYHSGYTGSFFTLDNISFFGFSFFAGIMLLMTAKDLAREIRKLF